MIPLQVSVVDTASANIASVLAAFERLGASPKLIDTPAQVDAAEFLVLPGVGSLAAVAERLRATGLDQALARRIDADRATLAICLGLQWLCSGSEESPGVPGLGLIPSLVRRYPSEVRTPQLGWNRVQAREDSRFLESGWAYFANSYRLQAMPKGWSGGSSEYAGTFVSALERGKLLACQFHPELSGDWGEALLLRWMLACRAQEGVEVSKC